MARGVKQPTPTDPVERVKYKTRRAANTVSARECRKKKEDAIKEGKEAQKKLEEVMVELKEMKEKLAQKDYEYKNLLAENENLYALLVNHECISSQSHREQLYRTFRQSRPCPCNHQPTTLSNGPVHQYNAVHNPQHPQMNGFNTHNVVLVQPDYSNQAPHQYPTNPAPRNMINAPGASSMAVHNPYQPAAQPQMNGHPINPVPHPSHSTQFSNRQHMEPRPKDFWLENFPARNPVASNAAQNQSGQRRLTPSNTQNTPLTEYYYANQAKMNTDTLQELSLDILDENIF